MIEIINKKIFSFVKDYFLKYNKIKITRNLPINFDKNNKSLFKKELIVYIPKPRIKKYRNIYYRNNRLFKFRFFEIHSKHWLMNKFKFKKNLKIFYLNLKKLKIDDFRKSVEILEKGIFFTDEKSHMYFHWMFDTTSRLELVKAKNYLDKYPILIDQSLTNHNFVKDTLKIYKPKVVNLKQNKTYKIKSLIVPFHLANSGNYNPIIIKNIQKRYIDNCIDSSQIKQTKKLWISRQNARLRKIENFDEVSEILVKNNFEIIELEKVDDLNQHVRKIYSASILGGLIGAGLSNMIFLKEGTKMIEVRGENDNHNNAYFSLSSILGINYHYFLAKVENNRFYSSNYYMDTIKFEKFLKDI